MSYKVAGIDVHKKVLMVVVCDVALSEPEPQRRRFGTSSSERQRLSAWLRQAGVEEAVMESTAQYWKPVWYELEAHLRLQLAQAYSNRAPHGRKHDFKDAELLVRRLVANELALSFVPVGEQRAWRTLTRMKVQLTREQSRLHSQLECLLEEMRIKLSSVLSDLLGVSAYRILRALAAGESDAGKLAELGDERLHCTREQLSRGCPTQAAFGLYESLPPPTQRASKGNVLRLSLASPRNPCHDVRMQSVFDAAGGMGGLRRLADAWHQRVMADEVVAHAFSHGFKPDHTERLAAYWAEAFGGPPAYSSKYGDETYVVKIHSGNGEHDEMNDRAIACFDQALEDVGLASNEKLRQALHDYFAWATTTTMYRYHRSADDVPNGLTIPRWSWDGLQE